jgi:hypothetical protein
MPVSVPQLSKAGIEDLAVTALSLPYEVPPLVLPPPPDAKEATKKQLADWQAECDKLEAEHDAEVKYLGMTCAEVMMVKRAQAAARGDASAMDALLDRALGRPKQSVESKSLKLSYEDYLKEQTRHNADGPVGGGGSDGDGSIVDVSISDPGDGLEGLL